MEQRHGTGSGSESLLVLPGHLPTSMGTALASTGVLQLQCPFNSGRHQTERWSQGFSLTCKISPVYVRDRFLVCMTQARSSELPGAWGLCRTCRPLTLFTCAFCGDGVFTDLAAYLQMPVLKAPLCHVSHLYHCRQRKHHRKKLGVGESKIVLFSLEADLRNPADPAGQCGDVVLLVTAII